MYEKMYYKLFNAITDAIELIEKMQPHDAAQILKNAQKAAEDVFIDERA